MSNIGKLNIIIPSVLGGYKDTLTELEGYKEEVFNLQIRTHTTSMETVNRSIKGDPYVIRNKKGKANIISYNQLIISRDINYSNEIFNSDIFSHLSNIYNTSNTSKLSEGHIRNEDSSGVWIRHMKSINISPYFNILLNQEVSKDIKLSIMPQALDSSSKDFYNISRIQGLKENNKFIIRSWGTLRSKLNEIVDSMFLVKRIKKDSNQQKWNDLEKRLTYNQDMVYKYGLSFLVRGIGYRIEYKKESREIELYIGYSNIIKRKVPLNLEIEVISGNEILIKPKYNFVKTNNHFFIESATFNDITQFTNQLKLIKPAYKDTYKNQGCESKIIRI